MCEHISEGVSVILRMGTSPSQGSKPLELPGCAFGTAMSNVEFPSDLRSSPLVWPAPTPCRRPGRLVLPKSPPVPSAAPSQSSLHAMLVSVYLSGPQPDPQGWESRGWVYFPLSPPPVRARHMEVSTNRWDNRHPVTPLHATADLQVLLLQSLYLNARLLSLPFSPLTLGDIYQRPPSPGSHP